MLDHLSEAPSNNLLDKHARILAELELMRDELVSTHETNDQLRADLHRETDRVILLTEERNRWRTEALIFRSRLIELAITLTNIGLQTRSAEEIVRTVNELTQASSEALEKLGEAYQEGNKKAAA